jgi:uncharacterized protein YjbJ (UPF0337 family)
MARAAALRPDARPIKPRQEADMNRDRIEGGLKRLSGKLREQWGALTRDATGVSAGRRDQLAGSMQARQGRSKEEIERQLRDFLHRNRDWNLSRH